MAGVIAALFHIILYWVDGQRRPGKALPYRAQERIWLRALALPEFSS